MGKICRVYQHGIEKAAEKEKLEKRVRNILKRFMTENLWSIAGIMTPDSL